MTGSKRMLIPTLSGKETVILDLLSGGREKYGNQLVAESDGQLKRGTVYVTLDRMEDKGFVESRLEGRPTGASGMPRRLYKVTAFGSSVASESRRYFAKLRVALGRV
jgi:PadR family transcriptional regulator, regulatory protein PadR